MPLRWEILHPQKLIHVVAEGVCTLTDLEAHFDAIMVANVLPYAKLFDASKASPIYDDHDAMMMGARLSAYTAAFGSGPLAVFGDSELVQVTFSRFVNLSPSRRPAALFKTEAAARAWLAAQDGR
jgi:hypothetical protein